MQEPRLHPVTSTFCCCPLIMQSAAVPIVFPSLPSSGGQVATPSHGLCATRRTISPRSTPVMPLTVSGTMAIMRATSSVRWLPALPSDEINTIFSVCASGAAMRLPSESAENRMAVVWGARWNKATAGWMKGGKERTLRWPGAARQWSARDRPRRSPCMLRPCF